MATQPSTGTTLETTYNVENNIVYEQAPAALAPTQIGTIDPETGRVLLERRPSDALEAWLRESGNTNFIVNNQNYQVTATGTMAVDAEGRPLAAGAFAEAERATQQILGRYEGAYEEALRLQRGAGTREAADITEAYEKEKGRGQQELVSRGLAGTTVLPTMRAGYERAKQKTLMGQRERLRSEKLGLHTGYQQAMAQFLERRTLAPWQMMQLAQTAGAGGQGFDFSTGA